MRAQCDRLFFTHLMLAAWASTAPDPCSHKRPGQPGADVEVESPSHGSISK